MWFFYPVEPKNIPYTNSSTLLVGKNQAGLLQNHDSASLTGRLWARTCALFAIVII